MTNCPVCNKPVDPLRARSVGFRAGKIVAYCSPECAAAADTQPVKVPAGATAKPASSGSSGVFTSATTPAPAAAPVPAKTAAPKKTLEDYDSGPVIEILHEPVSGVVTSARDPREDPSEPNTEPPEKPDKVDKKIEKALAKAEKRALKSEKAALSKPRTSDDSVTASGERDSSPDTLVTATASEGVIAPSVLADLDAAATPGARTQRRRRDSIDSKAGWEWLDDEPAEPVGRKRRAQPQERSKAGGFLLVLLVLGLAGAGGYLVYRYLFAKPADQEARVDPPNAGPRASGFEQVPVDGAAPPTAKELEQAVGTALAVLRNYLQSTSPRVQRSAADALARTHDPEAIEVLARLLQTEKIGRSVIAYILARSGDARGVDYLVAAMRTGERSDKLDAAARLAWLGDKRAADPLANFLGVKQVRFEAARNLAILRDPRGIAFFEAIRANQQASKEDTARAAIALALAGKPEVADEVREMLADNRMNREATAALVALKDLAARPVLVDHLQNVSMQTEAAQLLRTLEPNLDAWPIVKPLVERLGAADLKGKQDATKTTKDVNQIWLAETILLLAGPPHWADKK
jgi:HEAT repeat protein